MNAIHIGRVMALALALAFLHGPASAEIVPWVQLGPEGVAEARVVTDGQCPAAIVDGRAASMSIRAPATTSFNVRICALALPRDARAVSVDGVALPLPPTDVRRIVVIGDTGCRVGVQACNNSQEWPFARIAALAAEAKPDLIIHVGDYFYRESPCPADDNGCAGSPFGDNWAAWDADFFTPARPLLTAAPWVVVRGNHEGCKRGGGGWTMLLDPMPFDAKVPCAKFSPPYRVPLTGFSLAVADVASADEYKVDEKEADQYARDFAEIARLALEPGWLLLHRPPYGIRAVETTGGRPSAPSGNQTLEATLARAPLPPTITTMISGHIHALEALNYAGGLPPQLIVGHGGDWLDKQLTPDLSGLVVDGMVVSSGLWRPGFGFMVLDRGTTGWVGHARNADGVETDTCTIGTEITCVPAP